MGVSSSEASDALATRFADPAPKDRTALNEAYAKAMGELWRKYPEDDDVGTLYADALMNLRSWSLWSKSGKPWRRTEEIIATLERVLELNVNHPGANHLYIHAIEPSPNPERAEAAADRLAGLVPVVGVELAKLHQGFGWDRQQADVLAEQLVDVPRSEVLAGPLGS